MQQVRPKAVTIAAMLLALFSLLNLITPIIPAASNGVPAFIVYSGVALGAMGLVAAYGLWTLRRWGIWVAIVVSVLNILSASPGLVFAPDPGLLVFAIVTVLVFALIIVLMVLPASRRAHA